MYPIKILDSIFPENLVYSDKKYRTPNSDSIISLSANIAKVSTDSKTQKVTKNGDQSPVAPLTVPKHKLLFSIRRSVVADTWKGSVFDE